MTNLAANTLIAILSLPGSVISVDDMYRAGQMLDGPLGEVTYKGDVKDNEAFQAWAKEPVELTFTEKQKATCKASLTKGIAEGKLNACKPLFELMNFFGMSPD